MSLAALLFSHGFGQDNFGNNSQTSRAALSEEDGGPFLQKFRPVHEPESNDSLITRAHGHSIIANHFNHLRRLPYDSAMYHCLVVLLNSRCVVQYHNLCFKVKYRLGVGIFVDKDHTFAEEVPFNNFLLIYGFDAKAVGLTSLRFFNIDSLAVDGLDLNVGEATNLSRTKLQHVAGSYSA